MGNAMNYCPRCGARLVDSGVGRRRRKGCWMNQLILAKHVEARGEIRSGEELESYWLISPDLRPWALDAGPAVRDWLQQRGWFA